MKKLIAGLAAVFCLGASYLIGGIDGTVKGKNGPGDSVIRCE
jgi:hypothetical protein